MFEPRIKIGEPVDNNTLVEEFGCSPQGGMRRSHTTNTLVLISKHVVDRSKIYDDKMIDGIYHYTGMGQLGDQNLNAAQNKTLAESNTNGVSLHFFEVFEERAYTYMGRVKLVDEPYIETQLDAEGYERKVWMFPLKLVEEDNPNTYVPKVKFDDIYKEQERIAKALPVDELKRRAQASASAASARHTKTQTYIRNPYIAEFTKIRSGGNCELCKQPAPFFDKSNRPYLESHHIIWLSKRGDDSIENTAALCSNCHKKMHILNSADDVERLKALREQNV